MKNKSKPKVSIVCVTYNHERYIAQAIEGFLMQKTDFDFEIIIGEDCSLDNTKNIIQQYAEKNLHKIIATCRDKNIGALPNLIDILSKVRGEYVAICDGDDYWTDELKLQKQVDFLNKNLDFSMCCHNIKQIYENRKIEVQSKVISPWDYMNENIIKRGYLTFRDFFPVNAVASLSVMYRWNKARKLPKWMKKYIIGDLPLHLIHANEGKIGVINEVMGIYRKHAESSWFDHDTDAHKLKNLPNHINLLKDIDREFRYYYTDTLLPIINYMQKELDNLSFRMKNKILYSAYKILRKTYTKFKNIFFIKK